MLKDRKDRTALDYALNKQNKDLKKVIPPLKLILDKNASEKLTQDDEEVTKVPIYRKSAELILKNISNYPFGLFKVELKDLVATMIEE